MPISLPVLNQCCWCFSLRTGCLLIGYLILLMTFFSLSSVCWSLAVVVRYVQQHKSNPNPPHTQEELARVALSLYITHGYFILTCLYHVAVNLMLVIGVHTNKPKLLRYYFLSGLLLLALEVALILVTSIFMNYFVSIYLIIWCVLISYFLLVVRSTYQQMEEENKPRVFYEMRTIHNPQQAPLMA